MPTSMISTAYNSKSIFFARFLGLPKHFHSFPLRLAHFLRYHYLYCHVLVAFLVVIRRQLLHPVVRYLLLVVVLCAWVHFHADVAV